MAAVEAIIKGDYNVMVALRNDSIIQVPLEKAGSNPRSVPLDSEIIRAARYIGVSFGDETE